MVVLHRLALLIFYIVNHRLHVPRLVTTNKSTEEFVWHNPFLQKEAGNSGTEIMLSFDLNIVIW